MISCSFGNAALSGNPYDCCGFGTWYAVISGYSHDFCDFGIWYGV